MKIPLFRAILLVSLGCNLFLAGWIIGGFWRMPPPPPSLAQRVQDRISVEGFDKIKPALAELDSLFFAGADRMREHMDAIRKAAAAEPFDPEKVRQLVADLPFKRSGDDEKLAATIMKILVDLSPADRVAAADGLFRPPPPPPR